MNNKLPDNPGVIAPPPLIYAVPLITGLIFHVLQRTAQKAPFFHKTGMNGRSFRAGWDGDALGSRLVAEESVQGWRGFAVPAVKREKERKARHSHVLE